MADDGSTVHTQRYTLQPYVSGQQSIPPILVEFADNRPGQKPSPDDLDAYELLTERLDFSVKSVLPEDADAELNPPLGELELPESDTGSAWAWGAAGMSTALAALIAAVLFWRVRRRRGPRRNAYDVARARLDNLLARNRPHEKREVGGRGILRGDLGHHPPVFGRSV